MPSFSQLPVSRKLSIATRKRVGRIACPWLFERRPPTTPKCQLNRFIRRPCRSVGPPALNFLALRSSWSDPLSNVLNQSSSCIPTVQNTWSIDQLPPNVHRRVQISRNESNTVPKNATKPFFLGLTCSILGHGD